MIIACFEAEQVAGKIECANLATTVGENLVSANRAANNLVKKLDLLTLAVYLGVAHERHHGADHFDAADTAVSTRTTCLDCTAWQGSLAQHGGSPSCIVMPSDLRPVFRSENSGNVPKGFPLVSLKILICSV